MKHHAERTSPKGPGNDFIGTCCLCGKTGLRASTALEDCENVRGLSAEQALVESIIGPGSNPSLQPADGFYASNERPWPGPTAEMLNGDPLFDAIWGAIKTWDINVPHAYSGYMGATGNHARAIYDAVHGDQ